MKKNLIKTDFFNAINSKWLEEHKIPASKSGIGSFYTISDNLTKLKKRLLNKWLVDESEIKDEPLMLEMMKFYKLASNWQERRINGIKPLLPILESIEKLNSWKDVENNYKEMILNGLFMPVGFSIYTDFGNSKVQTLYIEDPSSILPEKKYYEDKDKKDKLYSVWSAMMKKLLKRIEKDENKVDELISKTLKYDELCSKHILSAEFSAVMTNIYNPRKMSEEAKKITTLNLQKIANELTGQEIENIVVVGPEVIEGYVDILREENFELYKAALYVQTVWKNAKWLDNSARIVSGEYSRFLSGSKKPISKEKNALETTADGIYSMVFGSFYGRKYFGQEAKANVENMIKNMIGIYKEQLTNNSWLSKQTIEKAIKKLDYLDVFVGYPSKINNYYSKFFVKEYDGYNDLLNNVIQFHRYALEEKFAQYGQPIDKELWSMSPAVVNAYYNPTKNQIVFPAGILQKPFYSLNQTSSENFGGIGAVIAHEISHGFDNNGSNFDELGNMKNWWTEDDKKAFEVKTNEMINLFEGREIDGFKCNGKLTVSENIADAGGLSCAMEAAKLEKDFNAKKFFTNYALIWRSKYRPETLKIRIDTDVHAPAKLRVNVQVQNHDDFYKAFDIKSNDKMYLAPKKRVKIW